MNNDLTEKRKDGVLTAPSDPAAGGRQGNPRPRRRSFNG
jgi:hypothetical protein